MGEGALKQTIVDKKVVFDKGICGATSFSLKTISIITFSLSTLSKTTLSAKINIIIMHAD